MYSTFHKLGYISSGSSVHRACIERASSVHRAAWMHTSSGHDETSSRRDRATIEHAPREFNQRVLFFAPQECRSLNTCSFVRLSVKIIREHKLIEGVLKAKPQTRHRAWLMCNERTLIKHASSEQKMQIECRSSRDRAEIERRPSGDRAEIERRSSTHGISFERLDNRAFRAARYVT